MITKIDPPDFDKSSTVQIDSDAGDPWQAIDEIETWAAEKGFVRTIEYHPRQVLVEGKRRFRAICYRISDEERAAMELAHRQMTDRGDRLRGFVRYLRRSADEFASYRRGQLCDASGLLSRDRAQSIRRRPCHKPGKSFGTCNSHAAS